MSPANKSSQFTDVRVSELMDEFTPSQEDQMAIAFQNSRTMIESARVISQRSTPLQYLAGEILSVVEPRGCALGGRRERKYYSPLLYERRRITVTIRRFKHNEVVDEKIRVTQFIPLKEVIA